ncbi:MFS transporter [Legionella londiniensis]|uniref:Major facilitator family transporter n=1 Tax=Legionella londiniensis TaxID=45068 RepID=A0A0W0VS56_9GAMM|nr:MFS transporter [Legionella londiniensis]KTD22931.1 major facilitator family transporter [Legionella londiniensis]STX92961.1 major facilitator family transporter [Legionella londiniensis]
MFAASISSSESHLLIWLTGVSFVLFQFFLQLSSGIVIGSIMHTMELSAFGAGLLGSSLYVFYTSLQIPVGILFDRKNTRYLMALNAAICGVGCLVFASSQSLLGLFFGRFLIGIGSAFAFVGFSHILRQHFPLKQFAFMIGLSETLAFIVTVIAMIGMGSLLNEWGWRAFINSAGIAGLFIAALCWKNIPDSPSPLTNHPDYGQQLWRILRNGKAWINGLFVGLNFTIVTVFGALWAVPFLQVKLNCSLPQASLLGAMFFLGAAVSCPFFGHISNFFSKRKPLIICSCISTNLLLLLVIYWPIERLFNAGFLMFAIGCCCGAYMLAFSIANELAPKDSLSTCTGFTNTLAMITAPLLQSFIGFLLDRVNTQDAYTLQDYQFALLAIPAALLIATILSFFLPEKKAH